MPNYNSSVPAIPDPRYNLYNAPQANMKIIEQDIKNYELKQRQQQEILNESERSITYEFQSHLRERGAAYYKIAFDTLASMLTGQRPLSIRKAVYMSEWAFFENTLHYADYDEAVKYAAKLIALTMKQRQLPNTNLAKNYAIFKFFSDTTKVRLPGQEKGLVTHYPIRYDFDDPFGEHDWTKGMVSKLLKYQTGQCHSLPLLYLILTEELGSTAYLANAPEHTYIKIPLANGKFQNLELTNGHMTTDSYVLSSGFIKAEALANRIYMRPLSKKETVAQSMIDLAKGYRNKYGFDQFYLNTVLTALAYQPDNVNGIYMLGSYYYWLFQHVKQQDPSIVHTPKEKWKPEVKSIYDQCNFYSAKLMQLGYEEMPKEVYTDWLKNAEKEKAKSEQMINVIQESIWNKK